MRERFENPPSEKIKSALEELIAPLIVSGSSLVVAVRDALRRHSRQPRVVPVQE